MSGRGGSYLSVTCDSSGKQRPASVERTTEGAYIIIRGEFFTGDVSAGATTASFLGHQGIVLAYQHPQPWTPKGEYLWHDGAMRNNGGQSNAKNTTHAQCSDEVEC